MDFNRKVSHTDTHMMSIHTSTQNTTKWLCRGEPMCMDMWCECLWLMSSKIWSDEILQIPKPNKKPMNFYYFIAWVEIKGGEGYFRGTRDKQQHNGPLFPTRENPWVRACVCFSIEYEKYIFMLAYWLFFFIYYYYTFKGLNLEISWNCVCHPMYMGSAYSTTNFAHTNTLLEYV